MNTGANPAAWAWYDATNPVDVWGVPWRGGEGRPQAQVDRSLNSKRRKWCLDQEQTAWQPIIKQGDFLRSLIIYTTII